MRNAPWSLHGCNSRFSASRRFSLLKYQLHKTKMHRNYAHISPQLYDLFAYQTQTATTEKGKVVPHSINERGARSRSWSLGSQSAGDLVINPAVDCLNCPPGLRFTFSAKEHHCPSAGTKLYCLVTEAHRCK